MNKRKLIMFGVYAAILILAFSWMLGAFKSRNDGLTESEVVQLFRQEQVRSFVVDGEIGRAHV